MTTSATAVPEPLAHLTRNGVSVWLDDLSRDRLVSGNLADLVATRAVTGVTTNPTIFSGSITKSDSYADDLARLAADGADAETAVRRLTVADVQAACDVLAPIHAATDGVDGRVSIEVDPRLAHDAEGTLWVGASSGLYRRTARGFEAVELVREQGLLSEEEIEAVLDPARMAGPRRRPPSKH